jgi:hypothetical protein
MCVFVCVCCTPQSRLSTVESKWKEFDGLYAEKLAVLQDDLARNEFKDRVTLNNDTHIASHASLSAWIATQEAYVNKKEAIDSVQDARVQLNLLAVFEGDKKEMQHVDVAAFKKLGKGVCACLHALCAITRFVKLICHFFSVFCAAQKFWTPNTRRNCPLTFGPHPMK